MEYSCVWRKTPVKSTTPIQIQSFLTKDYRCNVPRQLFQKWFLSLFYQLLLLWDELPGASKRSHPRKYTDTSSYSPQTPTPKAGCPAVEEVTRLRIDSTRGWPTAQTLVIGVGKMILWQTFMVTLIKDPLTPSSLKKEWRLITQRYNFHRAAGFLLRMHWLKRTNLKWSRQY